jgi:hypothetical protein
MHVKKALQISISVLYLILSIGIQVSIHYCGNYAEEIKLYSSNTKEPSDCCGEPCDTCCKTVVKEFHINDVHQAAVKYEPAPLQVLDYNQPVAAISYESEEIGSQEYYSSFLSPPINDTNILNCTFRV